MGERRNGEGQGGREGWKKREGRASEWEGQWRYVGGRGRGRTE